MSVERKAIIFSIVILVAILFSIPISAETQSEDQNWAETLQQRLNTKEWLEPWPEGEKVPCRCDILAIDYELCLRGIGREECFKKVKQPTKKQCSDNVKPGTVVLTDPPTYNCSDLIKKISAEEEAPADPEQIPGGVIMFNEVLPCHDANTFIMKMQTELDMKPFAQGVATVRNAKTMEFFTPKMVMLVNMENGHYLMLGVWPNGLGCVLSGGSQFEPYVTTGKS